MIEEFVVLARVMTIGAGLMLLAQIVANEIRWALKWPLVGMIVGMIGYLLNSAPLRPEFDTFGSIMDLISLSTPFFIWVFGRNLFEREPERRVTLIAAAILFGSWSIGKLFDPSGLFGFFAIHIVSLVLIVDLVRVGVFERDDDLVESRRVIRLWYPLLVAAQAASILIFEIMEVFGWVDSRSQIILLANTVIIILLALFAGLAMLRSDTELLVRTSDKAQEADQTETLNLTASEAVLHEKLTSAMAEGAWRQPGITIASLASQLDTPEHRLRALINRRMGYRNFSAFLNRHRIAEARQALVDKEKVDLPILTIAMDLGYNSLPTFNRAFRSETGTTPSEFRRLGHTQAAGQN